MAGTFKDREHAILSPSSAERWISCRPSARFEEQIAEQDSEFAAEGTLAHDLARLYLLYQLEQIDAKEYTAEVERIAASEHYCKEMTEHVTSYGDYVLSLGGDILVEHEYTFTPARWGLPRNWGTSDATNLIKRNGKTILIVTDLKYGAGVRVYARENKQAMCYAWGALNYFKEQGEQVDHVVINIYQPRVGDLPVNNWEISAQDLEEWAESELRESALVAIAGLGEFVIGDHCRFCKARNNCAAFYDAFKEFSDPRVLSADQRKEVLDKGDAVVKFINSIRNDARDRLLRGDAVKGYKLVSGNSSRKYTDPDLVADALHAEGLDYLDVYNVEVKPLTAVEKVLGKKRFNVLLGDLITRAEGQPQVVKQSDPRPSYGASLAQAYDDQDEDDDINSIL